MVEYLRGTGTVSTLGLWGRSMGAATALQHGDRDPSIAGMVIDSGFTSLEVLAKELVAMAREQGHSIPGFAVSIAMSMIKSSVKKKAKFKVEDLNPIAHVDRCFIPAVFVHGREDNFIAPHHSEEMHEHYAGDKQLMLVHSLCCGITRVRLMEITTRPGLHTYWTQQRSSCTTRSEWRQLVALTPRASIK